MVHGITNQMLEGKPPFSTAFRELFDWIKQCVQEASCKKDLYYPGKLINCLYTGLSFMWLYLFFSADSSQWLWFPLSIPDGRD